MNTSNGYPHPARMRALRDAGVAIWLDTLSCDLLESGEFSALVEEPTIFAGAIKGSDRYDAQLRALAADGLADARELFFAAALDDSAGPEARR